MLTLQTGEIPLKRTEKQCQDYFPPLQLWSWDTNSCDTTSRTDYDPPTANSFHEACREQELTALAQW